MNRRKLFLIISSILILSILMTACSNGKAVAIDKYDKTVIELPYEPISIKGNVEPYEVKSDLSNIENLQQFGKFSEEQLKLLVKNNFVVNPTEEEQLFYIYEDNQYKEIPSFVTTDSVLQVYHIFYDYTLRNLEEQKLLGLLEELTDNMLENSINIYENLKDQKMKEVQLKNIGYFSTAQLCLDKKLPDNIPEEAKNMALEEYKKIQAQSGFMTSSIFPYDLDYSQYLPRGHYTRSSDFERYFKAMMWYGQAPFPLYFNEKEKERNIEQTLQALLITYGIYSDEESYQLWEQIYEPTNFFVGSSDDLSLYEYGDLLFKVYGSKPNLNKLNDEGKLNRFYKEADKLSEPKIKAEFITVNMPSGKQFRFMGQRYVLDAEIIQNLVVPIVRPIPSGLDVMGVLGSNRAEEIQMGKEENQEWKDYPKIFKELKNKFSKYEDSEWQSNMYQGWLWTLKGLLEPYDKGYPSFMTNEAWVDKNLNTALASWAELKHDTILYGKQSGAECGDGYEVSLGYVEPNIEVYEKLLWLTKFSKVNLEERGLLAEDIDNRIKEFEDLLEFLINCSIKELNNEELTEEDYYKIVYYGGTLEFLITSFAEGDVYRWHEITSETDRFMALIADYHTVAPNMYSEAAVGPASEIYVVVPIKGKLYLTRGAVFSYYEFVSNERLTDEKWQQMLKEKKNPSAPEWTYSFIRGGKEKIPYPDWYN